MKFLRFIAKATAHPGVAERDKATAFSYVALQAVLLSVLLLVNLRGGFEIKKLLVIGTIFEWSGGLGILIAAYSIRTSLTALPLPKEHGKLATRGLYRYVRHPMYSSVLLLSLGSALLSGQAFKYLLVGALAGLFYYKSVYEERYLTAKYPGYQAYAKKTGRFIPFL
ncbi:MAG: isoprenylcysteine carboxylmethyltransferase family protein [Candidatus Saccharibacteria bacterium]